MERQDWDIERAKFDELAASHFEESRYPAALKWYRLSAALVEESMVEARRTVHLELPAALNGMARAYHFMCEYEYAVLYYSHSVNHNRYLGRFERTFDQKIAMANCWCTLGEVKATAAALERAFSESHFIVATDEPGHSELMEALDVLKSNLSDHVDRSSDQQKANAYALMRQVYRVTGKVEDAQEMHNLCAKHGRGDYDTTGHGLLMAQQSTEDACLYLQGLLEQPNVDHFRKRDAHNALGLVRVQKGRFKEARQHHLDALKLCFQQRCTNMAMLTYYYLGQVEHRASTGTESEEHYWKKGRLLAKKLKARAVSLRKCSADALLTNGRLERMSELYNYRLDVVAHEDLFAIADANVKLNNGYLWTVHNSRFILEKAHEALDLVGRLPEADSRVTDMLAKCHSQIGEAYCRMGKLEKASDSFRIALDIHHKSGNKIAQTAILVQMCTRLNQPDYRKDLEKALGVLEEEGGLTPSTLHKSLSTEVQTLLLSYTAQDFRKLDSVGAELAPVSIEDIMNQFARCKQAAEESFDAHSYIQAHRLMAGVHSWASEFFYVFAEDSKKYGLQDDFYEDVGLTRTSTLADVRKVNFRKLQKILRRATLEDERSPLGLDLRSKLEGSVPWSDLAYDEFLTEEKMHKAHLEFARRRGSPLALASSLTTIARFKSNWGSYKTRDYLEEAALLQSDFLFGVEAINGASLECMHITRVTHTALLECIAKEKDPAVHEEGLVWTERLRARTLLHAVESNMKKDPLMEIPQFDRDKRAAVKRLKEFSASCPGVVFVEYSLLEKELLIWVVKNGSIIMRQEKYVSSWALMDAVMIQMEGTLFMPTEDTERIEDKQRSAGRLKGFTRNGVRAFINGAVEAIRNSVRADEYLELLGRFLLLPIFEDLADVRQDQYIVFIPDQELLYVPFPALRLKEFENGNYLINRYPLFVSMSLRAYEHFERRYAEMKDKTAHRSGVSTVLIVSNPYPLDSSETMGLSPPHNALNALVNAEKEAQSIIQSMEKNAKTLHVHHLQRHQAQKATVMDILPKADWVHFACHGFVSERYPLGAIALGQTVRPTWLRRLVALIAHICMWLWAWLPSFVYQRQAGAANSEGILGADDINLQSGMQARCVVLNACNSAQGKITEEGILNWSHTLQMAGVFSIVLCLWEVHDLAGCLFMSEMYQNLTNKESLGLAFQKAMVAMINDQDRKWEPKHWAPYLMVGVPHVRLPVENAEC